MGHQLGISGSTILSKPALFETLFWKDIHHIEIGEFQDEASFQEFLRLKDEKHVTFGVHSPILRTGSKYDLIEKVHYEPEIAWELFEAEIKRLAKLKAEYILVHFPYFIDETQENAENIIESALKRLGQLQKTYGLPIVCEPKLGSYRSKAAIDCLHRLPTEIWERYGLHLCIDIGDYLLAAGKNILEYIRKWQKHIKVVHLHNIEYIGDRYIWVPVHPSHETDGIHFKIEKVIRCLAESKDLYFILEHTPHLDPGNGFAEEGARWIQTLIEEKP